MDKKNVRKQKWHGTARRGGRRRKWRSPEVWRAWALPAPLHRPGARRRRRSALAEGRLCPEGPSRRDQDALRQGRRSLRSGQARCAGDRRERRGRPDRGVDRAAERHLDQHPGCGKPEPACGELQNSTWHLGDGRKPIENGKNQQSDRAGRSPDGKVLQRQQRSQSHRRRLRRLIGTNKRDFPWHRQFASAPS